MADRVALEKMVWKKFPTERKVRASNGTLAVSVYEAGKTTMKALSSMTVPELFAIYRRVTLPVPAL